MPKQKAKSKTTLPPAEGPPARRQRVDRERAFVWIAVAALGLAIGIVYGPAVGVPFIFDDQIAIVANESITSLWPLFGNEGRPGPLSPGPGLPTTARPLVNLSLALNYYFGKLDPRDYQATNAVIHFLSALVLWAIVRRTLRLPRFGRYYDRSADWLALAVAALWAMHPLQTEAVIYATQRTELMMALFYLATLYCSLRYWSASRPWPRSLWLALATLSCASGMASKEVMASAPLIVLLFERTFVAGSLGSALRRSWRLYACLASTWVVLLTLSLGAPHSHSAGFGLGVPAPAWWLTQCKALLLYLKLVVWPWPLLIHYQFPYLHSLTEAWMFAVPVGLLGVATLELLRRNHPAGFLGCCVFAVLSPTFVVPILTEMAAERRMYLPLAALAALVVVGGHWLVRHAASLQRRPARGTSGPAYGTVAMGCLAMVIAATFGLVSARRLEAYRSEMYLWQQVLDCQPANSMAHENVAHLLAKTGDLAGAIEEYRHAVRLQPGSAQGQYSLGLLLHESGAHGDAAAHFAAAARALPQNATIRHNLAVALYMAGRNDEAIAAFRQTLALEPSYWSAHKNLGNALQRSGKFQEAIESYQRALELNPKAFEVYHDLARAYAAQNERKKALDALRHGLELAHDAGDAENARRFDARLAEFR